MTDIHPETLYAGLDRPNLLPLGASVGYGEAHIASVEQGRRIPKPEMVDAVDRVVGGRGVLVAMKGEVERARYPSFFRQYARLEAEATQLHAYDSHVVKGLLQSRWPSSRGCWESNEHTRTRVAHQRAGLVQEQLQRGQRRGLRGGGGRRHVRPHPRLEAVRWLDPERQPGHRGH